LKTSQISGSVEQETLRNFFFNFQNLKTKLLLLLLPPLLPLRLQCRG
jgi:hypothetical protein